MDKKENRKMTEYELVDAIASFNSNVVSMLALYISVLSAYIFTAYVIGTDLSRSQALTISFGFTILAFIIAFATFAGLNRSHEFIVELRALNPAREFSLQPWVIYSIGAVLLIGIIMGLKFMRDVRGSNIE